MAGDEDGRQSGTRSGRPEWEESVLTDCEGTGVPVPAQAQAPSPPITRSLHQPSHEEEEGGGGADVSGHENEHPRHPGGGRTLGDGRRREKERGERSQDRR